MFSTYENTLKDLKAGKYAPVYFLHGDEAFYMDKIAEFVELHVLPDSEKGFNQIILYGKDVSSGEILNQARRYPMMAERQVMIIKEFQQVVDLGKEESFKLWEHYLTHPQPSTLLLLCHKHKTLAKNTKFYKLLEKNAVVIESKKIYENQVPEWIGNYLKEKGYKIEPKAALLLSESVGAELGRLSTELDKIILNLQQGQAIQEQMIEKFVGISKDFNVFELQKAIISRNRTKSFQILQYWAGNPKKQPLIPTLVLLFSFFSKILVAFEDKDKSDANLARILGLPPFLVKDYKPVFQHFTISQIIQAIHLIRRADLQAKGIESGGETDAEILKELVFRII